MTVLVKFAFFASMSVAVLGATLPNVTPSLPKGLTPLSPEDTSIQACYKDNWSGKCDNGYCWATCDEKGRWAWLVYNGGNNNWAGCHQDSDCSNGLSSAQQVRKMTVLAKFAFFSSMSVAVLGAVLPNEAPSSRNGLSPLNPTDSSVQGCYPNNWDGMCDKGYCWRTCDVRGNWAWLVIPGGNNWVSCNFHSDCTSTSYVAWSCGGC
ncbi:hypothetical protein BGZ73_008069 [Actinomortierella ambigua]|nr:hypothetical protein BGZ73_008069 [Actinomortierella ambigua]